MNSRPSANQKEASDADKKTTGWKVPQEIDPEQRKEMDWARREKKTFGKDGIA